MRGCCVAVLLVACAWTSAVQAQAFAFGQNRVQYARHAWRTLATEHVDVYYFERPETAPGGYVLAAFAGEAAEEAYREVAALFGTDIARRIPLLVYPTHAAFSATDAADLPLHAEGIGGVTERYKNRIAIPFTGDWRQFRRVVHHELVHAVVNDLYFGGSVQAVIRGGLRLRLPLWFSEGLAEWSAAGWETHSDLYLRDAVLAGRLPPVDRLGGYLAYRGGQSVWDFLALEYGREKTTDILRRVGAGRSVTDALRRATGLSVGELTDRWRESLRAVHGPDAAAREPVDAVGRPLATPERGGGATHASPAISPQGDRVAYVSTRDGLFDVLVVPTVGVAPPETLVDGQETVTFERLRLLSPGLSWSPDGTQLAVAVTSGPGDAVVLLDVRTRAARTLRPRGIDAIASVAWSPDGERLAIAGTAGAHSDLFVLDLASGAVTNVTRDLYGDHAPAWSPDGASLLFHSDRGDALALGAATAEAARDGRFDAAALGRTPFSVYRVRVDQGRPALAERLTPADGWDATFPQAGAGADGRGERVLFVSDRNGVPNLYTLADPGAARPLTDLQTGALGVSLSADGQRAALLALRGGVPSVYLVRDPFGRPMPAALAPTVWAVRRAGTPPPGPPAPALALAPERVRDRNPFLRDATDGQPPGRPPRVPRRPSARDLALADSLLALLAARDPRPVPGDAPPPTEALPDPPPDPFEARRRADGRLVPTRYRLRFSPDLVAASGSYDTVYGVQSITQMLFSDLLGEHRIALATNLVLDLRNADYLLRYENRGGRTEWGVEGFHLARELDDTPNATVYRYRNYGVGGRARYALSRFRRVEADLGLLGVALTDLSTLTERPRTREFVVPRVTYTADWTVPGFLSPQRGLRYAASLSGSPGPDANFATLLADVRRYWRLAPGTVAALRAAAGLSLGPDPQRFYASGQANWLGASFDSLPVEGADDFVFATPVQPLRGFGFNEAAGDRYLLVNAEVRVPLVAALVPGPLPLLPLADLHAVAFADAAVLADGGVDVWRTPVDSAGVAQPRVLDDVLVGTGVGLRTVVLGYPVRADWAWPFDGRTLGRSRFYLSLGLDF